jgi:hypothetical protein
VRSRAWRPTLRHKSNHLGREQAMEHIGIDVHKRESQVCVLGEAGEVVLERRVPTQREKRWPLACNNEGRPAWSSEPQEL